MAPIRFIANQAHTINQYKNIRTKNYILRWSDNGCCTGETCRLLFNLYLCHLLTLNMSCFRRNKYSYIGITQLDGNYQKKLRSSANQVIYLPSHFMGPSSFSTLFTIARHLSLSWAGSIHSKKLSCLSVFHRAFFNSIIDKTPTHALFIQHYISLECWFH